MTFRVAVLQMRSVDREYESNIKTIIQYMSDAKQNGADIFCCRSVLSRATT